MGQGGASGLGERSGGRACPVGRSQKDQPALQGLFVSVSGLRGGSVGCIRVPSLSMDPLGGGKTRQISSHDSCSRPCSPVDAPPGEPCSPMDAPPGEPCSPLGGAPHPCRPSVLRFTPANTSPIDTPSQSLPCVIHHWKAPSYPDPPLDPPPRPSPRI